MSKEEEIIRETFNRLLLPQTEIAIMKGYGSVYTPENIEVACNRFKVMVEDKLRAKGYTKQEEIKRHVETKDITRKFLFVRQRIAHGTEPDRHVQPRS